MERRGDWTYCALAIRHLGNEDAGNYTVSVRNKYGEKSNFVRLSMKDKNEPTKYVNSFQIVLILLKKFQIQIKFPEYQEVLNLHSSENHLQGKKETNYT